MKRTLEKEAVHDADLELFAIQKAQEKENQFGQRVQKNLIIPPNVVVKASKSGKSSGEKHYAFLTEVLRPLVGKKFLLFLDCWKTQADLTTFRAVFPNQNSQ